VDVYPFAQAWPIWVFGVNNLTHASTVLSTMSTWVQSDAYSVKAPGETETFTDNSAWLAMALSASGTNPTLRAALYQKARVELQEQYPNVSWGDNGVFFSDQYLYSYGSDDGWSWLSLVSQLTGGGPPSGWWQ